MKQEWTDKITAWRKSGQSIAAWWRQHGESYYRFIYWRKRQKPKQEKAGRFVELTLGASSLR